VRFEIVSFRLPAWFELLYERRQRQGDCSQDFPDGHFDLVVFTLSLHHQQSSLALGEAVRVLRKGGRVVIVEPKNGGEVGQVFGLLRMSEAVPAQQWDQASAVHPRHGAQEIA